MINLNEGKSEAMPTMKIERSAHSCVLLNNSIYVAGGQHVIQKKTVILNSVERYDLEKEQWYTCKSMLQKRFLFSLVRVGNDIYAIGGKTEDAVTCTAEKYNPVEDKWTLIESMTTPRIGAASAVLNQSIYMIGGSTKTNARLSEVTSVECFDTATEKWAAVGDICQPRDFIMAVAIDEKSIMAVGGFNSAAKECNTVEIYNAIEDKWTKCDDMAKARAGGIIFSL